MLKKPIIGLSALTLMWLSLACSNPPPSLSTSTVPPTQEPTATPSPTNTTSPTSTPVPTATMAPISTPTLYPVPTVTMTPTSLLTFTPSPPTYTPLPTATPYPTHTPRPTYTPLPTATPHPTRTPVPTPRPTFTPNPTPTPHPEPTLTPTPIPTATPRPTATQVPTSTPKPHSTTPSVLFPEPSSEWNMLDHRHIIPNSKPFITLEAYEVGYQEEGASILVSCYDFTDTPYMGFHISWDTYVSVLDDISVYIKWDKEKEVRQDSNWDSAGTRGRGIRAPSPHIRRDFLNRLASSTHLEVRAHGLEMVEAKFNTSGFAIAVAPVMDLCK